MSSLRGRMIFLLLTVLVIGGSLAAATMYFRLSDELSDLFDSRLQAIGNNLVARTLSRDALLANVDEEDDIIIQAWDKTGRLLFSTSSEDRAPMPSRPGLTSTRTSEGDWRSYARTTEGGGYLQVAQDLSTRREMAAASSARLLWPLLALLPLLAAFIAWTVSRQLSPLRSLVKQLKDINGPAHSSIVMNDAPLELAPVVSALNEMLSRQAETSRQQRAFLADAAHELRTPLSVVSLQAQYAQQAKNPDDRQEALASLRAGVDRATRLVQQLLDLARYEARAPVVRPQVDVDFQALVKTVIAELYPMALTKCIDMGLNETAPCSVHGDYQGLHSLVVNLVDNAIRYTPSEGRVDISLQRSNEKLELVISDTGPGISHELRPMVLKRFVRGSNTDSGGTGLGLAIASQIVDSTGGLLALEDGDNGQGLKVSVRLPMARSSLMAKEVN